MAETEPDSSGGRTNEELSILISNLSKYLKPVDLLNLRPVCKVFNQKLKENGRILKNLKLILNPNWDEEMMEIGSILGQHINYDLFIPFEEIDLRSLPCLNLSGKSSRILKQFWSHYIGQGVLDLNIIKCSIHLSALKYLVEKSVNLETLTMYDVRLIKSTIKKPNFEEKGEGDMVQYRSKIKSLYMVKIHEIDKVHIDYLTSVIRGLQGIFLAQVCPTYASGCQKLEKIGQCPAHILEESFYKFLLVNSNTLRACPGITLSWNLGQGEWIKWIKKNMPNARIRVKPKYNFPIY